MVVRLARLAAGRYRKTRTPRLSGMMYWVTALRNDFSAAPDLFDQPH